MSRCDYCTSESRELSTHGLCPKCQKTKGALRAARLVQYWRKKAREATNGGKVNERRAN